MCIQKICIHLPKMPTKQRFFVGPGLQIRARSLSGRHLRHRNRAKGRRAGASERALNSDRTMAEVLVFYIAIRYWVLIPLTLWVIIDGARRYFVSKFMRCYKSAQIVIQRLVVIWARNLRSGANFISARSFRANKDQRLASSKSYVLPEDLVINEILSRLPVKSLIRFKSVCRRWHSLPTNPSFIASHLKHINTPNRLASWNGNDNGLISRHDGFHIFAENKWLHYLQPVNLNFGFDRKPDVVLGPCDGIFCLYWKPYSWLGRRGPIGHRVERLPTIALWNPATRDFSILPMSQFDFPPYKKVSECVVGFGFDLTTKSIKVVKVVCFPRCEDDYINCAEVYNLFSGSWRVLLVDDIVQGVNVLDSPMRGMYCNNDGVFHWLSARWYPGIRQLEDYVMLVLSFDMSRELFHVTLMPEKYNIITWSSSRIWKECTFSLLRDSLAVNFSFFKDGHATVELWVMKKDFDRMVEAGESFSSYSWSHELTVEVSNPSPCVSMGFWNKNELLIWKRDWTRYGGTPLLYDIDTKQARDLEFSGELNFLYKESLVSVKGGCGNYSIPY